MKLPLALTTFKPLLYKIKNSGITVLILVWLACLIFVWWKSAEFVFGKYKPFETLAGRWLATAILVIIAIVFISWKMIQRLKTLEARQQEDKRKQHNPIREEIETQRRHLDLWVNRFKRVVERQDYQYALPWYIALGTEGSGKKTLLKDGGHFVELCNPIESSGESVHFTVLSNEKAVVLCPKNTLISQQDNVENKPHLYSKLWNQLLNWTRETRPRQPLNGIILTIDLYQLLTSNKTQKDHFITQLHQRLNEILAITQTELPIYVIMNKLDRFYGFQSIYEMLTTAQKESALGITFELNEMEWKQELQSFWQEWVYQMNAMMPTLLFKDNLEKQNHIFSYIRQLSTAIEIICPFLEQLIANGGKSFHFFKGVYLTSATQNGKIDNVFVQSASEQYQLGNQSYSTWAIKNTQPYFSYTLFKDILFSFPNLAKENSEWRKSYHRKLKLFSIIGGIIALGLVGLWHHYYNKNYNAGINVLKQVKTFKDIKISDQIDYYGDKQLPILNPIREATLAYGNYHKTQTWLKDMGLYQGYFIGPYVEETYLKLLQLKFLPAIMNGLLVQLNEAEPESEGKLEILRIMRMLDDKTGRDDNFVKDFMKKYWSEKFKGQKDLQNNLMLHLDYSLQHTDWFNGRLRGDEILIETYHPYELAIKEAQDELSRSSIYNRVYQNLKIKANSVLAAPLDYRNEIGSGFDDVYFSNNDELLKIPRFFTENGLKNYFIKQDSLLVELIAMDSWVLNLKENLKYSDTDREKMLERISEQYVNDYIATWRSALNNLDIKEFETLSKSITAIEKITGGEQTLKRALQVLNDNTLPPALPNEEGKALQQAFETLDYRLMAQIDHSFSDEKSVLQSADDKNGTIQSIYQKLSNLHRYLLSIQNAPDSGKAALKAVQFRIDQKSTDPILELQQLAKTMPQPVSRWLKQIADYSWRSILKSAIVSLEVEWNEKVVKKYKLYIKGRYPFASQAQKEVPLSEFSRFFAPGGTIDSFYETNLKPFIESDLGHITDNGESLIRPDVIEQLELAQRIRDTFFNSDNGIGVHFGVEPLSISSNKRRSVLNLDGQIVDYAHGLRKKTHIVWPNSMNNNVESKLTLVSTDEKSPRSLTFKGPWAQIKLLTSGKISNVKTGSFDVRYNIHGGYATYRIHMDESDNPFSWDMLGKFNIPETLY